MNPIQVELARHALGLDGSRTQSYRNYFVAHAGTPDHAEWLGMVEYGFATRMHETKAHARFGGSDCFWLTREAATAALRGIETLDPEDFRTAAVEPRPAKLTPQSEQRGES